MVRPKQMQPHQKISTERRLFNHNACATTHAARTHTHTHKQNIIYNTENKHENVMLVINWC